MKTPLAARLGMAIAALLMCGFTAGAQAPGGGPGFGEHRPPFEKALGPQGKMGRWWNNPEMVEKLKLTDAQRKAMDGIMLEHRERLIDLRGAVEKAELELEPLMGDEQPNEARILAQIDKVAQARAELEKANARFLLAIRGKLTPEQWKLLQAERMNRGGEHREMRMERREYRFDRRGTQPPPPPPGAGAPAQGAGPQGQLEDEPGPQDQGAPPQAEAGAAQ